jgi:hypothetical protein
VSCITLSASTDQNVPDDDAAVSLSTRRLRDSCVHGRISRGGAGLRQCIFSNCCCSIFSSCASGVVAFTFDVLGMGPSSAMTLISCPRVQDHVYIYGHDRGCMSWLMMPLMMHPILLMQKYAVFTIVIRCFNLNHLNADVEWGLWIMTDFVRGIVALNKGCAQCNAAYSNRDVSAHENNVGTTHDEPARTRTTWEQRTTNTRTGPRTADSEQDREQRTP